MKIYNTKEHNVIVYGMGNTLNDTIEYIEKRYDIVGLSDSNQEKAHHELCAKYKFYMPTEIPEMDIDFILINSIYEKEITAYLIDKIRIPAGKVLRRDVWQRMLFKTTFGEANQDKTFYLMSKQIRKRNGLLSIMFSFLEQLDFVDRNGYIPVADMQSFSNQYLEDEKIGFENSWEYYYEQLSEYSVNDVINSKNVILGYDDPCYQINIEQRYDLRRMSTLYKQYIKIKPAILNEILSEYGDIVLNGPDTLGVLYRGTDMISLQLKNHPIQPALDELIISTKKYMKDLNLSRVFVSTEDNDAIIRFREEFGSALYYTNQLRYSDTGSKWIADLSNGRQNDKYLRGLEYLTTIEILSKCDSLIAGVSAGSVCALIMNDFKYSHYKLLDKGTY